jgi:hypothetical protein
MLRRSHSSRFYHRTLLCEEYRFAYHPTVVNLLGHLTPGIYVRPVLNMYWDRLSGAETS